MGRAVKYRSAGTVEFVLDAATQDFYFLEVNTRLQVEHGVTETVTGVDLVEWMVREAGGDFQAPAVTRLTPRGAAIEVRLYAEDPAKNYQPSTGTLMDVAFDETSRVDGWIENGTEITPHYDPLLAKIITKGDTRDEAIAAMARSLAKTRIAGVETNLDYLKQVVATAEFRAGDVSTKLLAGMDFKSTSVEVLEGGTQTTVQDLPGRLGGWAVGVPPSGPMDDFALSVANRLVGNDDGAAALEMTLTGPSLRFRSDTIIALAGARMKATLAGQTVPFLEPIDVKAGQEVRLGAIVGRGCRAYLAVRGGIDVPSYLGSKATFMLGRFGGHGGRTRPRSPTTPRSGRSACSTAPTGRRTSSPPRTSRPSTPRPGRSTTTRIAPAFASSGPSRSGRAATAARRACTRRTSTTTPTPSAPSTTRATCPSSSARTGRASAASSAR
jgi:urea carboxylase